MSRLPACFRNFPKIFRKSVVDLKKIGSHLPVLLGEASILSSVIPLIIDLLLDVIKKGLRPLFGLHNH